LFSGKGVANVKLYDVNGSSHDIIYNALYVPSYKQDIISVNAAVKEGGSISLDVAKVKLYDVNGSSVCTILQTGYFFRKRSSRGRREYKS
jgi:hypothetical protein